MAIQIKTRTILIGVILSLMVAFFGGWYYGYVKEKKASQIALNSLKDTIQTLTVQINDTEYQVTKTEQELATERQLRKQDIIEKATLKALNIKHVNEISKLKLRIDTLLEDVNNSGGVITIHDTITQEPKNYVKLPFVVTKKDQWLSLKDSTDIKGKTFIALTMDVPLDIVTGYEKSGKPTISVLTPNTYVGVVNIKSWKTDAPKVKPWGIGAQFGYGINKNFELSPYLGVGISRNFIRF